MRFLFVHAWRGFSLAEWYLREALSAHRSIPVEVRSLDLPPDGVPPTDCLERTVTAWRPDLVGFSCHYWSRDAFLEAAARVKHLEPQTRVVLGGPQVGSVSSAAAALERQPAVDFVVRGPGSEALCALVTTLGDPSGAGPDRIGGLSYRDGARLVHNAEVETPPPSRGPIFHHGNRLLTEQLGHVREASYETVTGCRSRCLYCVYPDGALAPLDDDLVMGELAYLCAVGVPHVRICDAHFGGSAGRAKKLLRHLASVNRRSSFKIYPDLRHIDAEYLDLVEAAGAEITSIGIQTTNRESLKRIRRRPNHEHRAAIELILQTFPATPADVIVGLPGDTPEGLGRTFRDVLGLGFSAINVFRLHVFPASDLGRDPAAHMGSGKTTCTVSGQVLSSPGFPVESQAYVTQQCHAAELAAVLQRTREWARRLDRELFDELTERLSTDRLLYLHDALFPFNPERTVHRLVALREEIATLLCSHPEARDQVTADVVEHLRRQCRARRCDRLEWDAGDHRRVVAKVLLALDAGGYWLWDLARARVERVSGQAHRTDSAQGLLVIDASGARPRDQRVGDAP